MVMIDMSHWHFSQLHGQCFVYEYYSQLCVLQSNRLSLLISIPYHSSNLSLSLLTSVIISTSPNFLRSHQPSNERSLTEFAEINRQLIE